MRVSAPTPNVPTGRFAMTFLRLTPAPIIAAPERILLKFACMMIGVGLLVSVKDPTSTLAAFPDWTVYELGITFTVGGLASLIGIFRRNRPLERFGVALTALGAVSYAAAIVKVFGPSRFAGVIIFAGVALACLTRLAISSAAMSVLIAARANSYMPPEELEAGDSE